MYDDDRKDRETGKEAEAEEPQLTPETEVREDPELTPESVRAEIRRTRHKLELHLYRLCIFLGIIAAYIMIYRSLTDDTSILDELRNLFAESELAGEIPDTAHLAMIILFIIGMISGIGALIGLIAIMLLGLFKLYGEQMAYSIRVSEKNFPEIYEKVKEYSRLLGFKKEPEVYVCQENGEVNAFSAWIPGKSFIKLNAEIVDISILEHKDLDTVCFVMAHEMGHIYLHHVQIYYNIWAVLVNFIPFFGSYVLYPAFSRAREYSADRVAQAVTGGKNQEECMLLLGAGRHLYKHLDVHDYISDIMRDHGVLERLARWVVNLIASHPIMPFRTAAVLDPEKKSGRIL